MVGEVPIGTSTFVDKLSDIKVLNNQKLTRGVYSRSSIPGNIRAISEPYYDRVFVGFENTMLWSEPGRPGLFKKTSEV